jgi:Ubiquitin family
MVKVNIGEPEREKVRELKERAFKKEREEGKNVRLIYQGKILQDGDYLAKYSKHKDRNNLL